MLEYSKKAEVLTMEQSSDVTNNQQERQLEIAWLVGLWEGEGTFILMNGSKNRIIPRASIINTDFVLIDEIAKILKKNNVGHYIQIRKGGCDSDPRHKDAKVIIVAGYKRIVSLLMLFAPYLRGKKKQVAEAVYGFVVRRLSSGPQARYSNADLEAVKTVRALNKKGPIESSETTCQPLAMAREDIVQVA